MRPLTLDDLLPLQEFASRRREFFESTSRYIDRYRRIRLGPGLTLLFENRQTLWFRVQEILRITRLSDPARVQEELELYNRLLPRPNELQAALLLVVGDGCRPPEELSTWQGLQSEDLELRIGQARVRSQLVTCRPEDLAIGAAHWVRFSLSSAERGLLTDVRQPVSFELQSGAQNHESAPINAEVRQSLLDDLILSDKD